MGLKDILMPPLSDYEDYSKRYSKIQRISMFIEAIGIYAAAMILLWVFWWEGSVAHNSTLATTGLVVILVYMLFISPRIYKETSADWGMGSVVDYFQHMFGKDRKRKPGEEIVPFKRGMAILWFSLIMLALVIAIAVFWDILAPFAVDWLNSLIQNLNMKEGLGVEITEDHIIGAAIFAAALIVLILLGMFRYDNFKSSFKIFGKMIVLCLPAYLIIIAIYYFGAGPDTWTYEGKDFEIGDFALGWLGYIVWGSIQQLLFLGYFNTRLRKSMLGYEWKYSKWAPILCTFINASFFAIIHLPSTLAIITFIGGGFFSWYFQKKDNQNVFVSGIFHGLFGTLVGSYLAFIAFSVGPETIIF
jgi:CAAX prenyl protease-like protein